MLVWRFIWFGRRFYMVLTTENTVEVTLLLGVKN
jgi:hypothetical protein